MTPTILVIGATGNTGKSVVSTLPALLESSKTKYRILGLTRSITSPAAEALAKLPKVEILEKDWTTIDAEWLQTEGVECVYIAPHNLPNQFEDESGLYVALLNAGVKYVVKLSTSVGYLSPNNPVAYGRAHWAIENLLSQPEFEKLQWTSLQPNIFTNMSLAPVVNWIQEYQKTGIQQPLGLTFAADIGAAFIDPEDIGELAAHLLALEDPSPHNNARYVLNGPNDITGNQVVGLVEDVIGIKVKKVNFSDSSLLYYLVQVGVIPEKRLPSLLASLKSVWEGSNSIAVTPTSREVLKLAAPKRTVADTLKAMLATS
jgi:uncharacterized protein YbjT (DUF2867 family)